MASDDAELRIVVDDQMSKALRAIEKQVHQFGTAVGAEMKSVDKAVTQVQKSMGTLAATGTGKASKNTLAAQMQEATAELKKYQAEMKRLENAKTTTQTPFGVRGANGSFVGKNDAAQYQAAAAQVQQLEAKLRALPEAHRRIQQAETERARAASQHNQEELARLRQTGAAMDQARAKQQAMYNEMFGRKQWWPPEALKSSQGFAKAITETSNSTRYVMYDVARNAAIGGAALLGFGAAAVVAAARFEASFAAVERTVGGTEVQLENIRQDLIGMSQDIPVAFAQLSEIASVGAQMGIGAEGIANYTETVAKLTATTNLTADAAGKALGRFKAFFAEADDDTLAVTDQTFSNLASSILKVGVNSVATEQGIVNVATQISSMGSYAGFTADQVVGLAGALSSVGVPPELSRGVVTRLFNTMAEAVSEGGVKLDDFAGIAGVSANEFAEAWGTDKFAYIFTDFISGLNGVSESGGDAVSVLHELGINSVRDVPVLLRLAGAAGEVGIAGTLLAQTMNDARSGWRENIELALQYSKISQTVSARTQVMLQNFEALFATMGEASLGPIKAIIDGIIFLTKGFTAMAGTDVGQVISTITIGFAVLAGTVLLAVSAMAAMGAATLGAGQALKAMGIPLTTTTALVRGLSFALIGLGVLGAIAGLVSVIASIGFASSASLNPVTDLGGAFKALETDTKAGSGVRIFAEEVASAGQNSKETTTQAERLGGVLGMAKDEAYGASGALRDAGESAQYAALLFGKASTKFLSSSIANSVDFQDIFKGDIGGQLADRLTKGGFDLDEFSRIMGQEGRNAAESYLEGFTGVETKDPFGSAETFFMGPEFEAGISFAQDKLLDIGESGKLGMGEAARAAQVAADGMITFTSATQIAGAEMDEFVVQNEDAIKSIAEGFRKFTDTSSLIGFTQQWGEVSRVTDDLNTDVDEAALAVGEYEKAWQDAYGGASFSLGEYMTQFERAAAEQAEFTQNIQTLFARGLDPKIIGDLAAMGPQAAALVRALVTSTDAELQNYEALYQQTGFDSMVGLAAGQLAAQQIIRNAAQTLGTTQLQELSATLAAGTPLDAALAAWNLDAEGKPINIKAKMTPQELQKAAQSAADSGIYVPITPYLTKTNIYVPPITSSSNGKTVKMEMYDQGGYTGNGGKYDPAGTVHRGEFVFPQESVRAIGLSNLYSMMRATKGGSPAKRGSFASGGYAGTGSSTSAIVHLSVEDRQLLIDIRERVGITVTEKSITGAANSGNADYATRRTA